MLVFKHYGPEGIFVEMSFVALKFPLAWNKINENTNYANDEINHGLIRNEKNKKNEIRLS